MGNIDNIESLWVKYKQTESIKIRNTLIIYYSPIVKQAALRIWPSYKNHFDMDDIISFGTIGLIDAIEKYDTEREIKFETYASYRICGSIIDQIRQLDWVPRSIREKSKWFNQATAKLESTLMRAPNDNELSKYLDISVDELHEEMRKLHIYNVVSLDDQIIELINHDDIRDEDYPEKYIEISELKSILSSALDDLTEKERNIVSLYYFEELTLKEIGLIVGVSESRVSQLHSRALKKLKDSLSKYVTNN